MSPINNIKTFINETKNKLNEGFQFSLEDHLISVEALKDCSNDLEASATIGIIGKISWNRKTIEKEIIDQVFHYITSEVCVSFGTLAVAEGVSWVFSQWVDAGFDTVSEYYWKFRDYLLGVGDDNLYTIQPIAISAVGNYLKSNKNRQLLKYLLIFAEEIKYYDSDFVCNNEHEQEKLILNQHFEFRYKDSIDALKMALKLPKESDNDLVLQKARERLFDE